MRKFIADNLKYPVVAQEAGIQGRVSLRYIVSKTGKIQDIVIVRGISPECDAEALRVVKAMPDWVPGKHDGEVVDAYFTLPIVFKLKGGDTPSGYILILDGKEISEAALKKEIEQRQGKVEKQGKELICTQLVLSEKKVQELYGGKYKGKKVV